MRNQETLANELTGILTTVKEQTIPPAEVFPDFGDEDFLNKLKGPPLSRTDFITNAGGPLNGDDISGRIIRLKEARNQQIANLQYSQAETTKWYYDLIVDIIKWMGIIIAAYSLWTSHLMEDLAENIIQLILEVIGGLIEKLVDLFKGFAAVMLSIYSTLQTAIGSAGPPNMSLNAVSTSVTGIADIMAEIWEQISGMGSWIVSTGGILGSGADIDFDIKRLSFSLNSTAGQVQELVRSVTTIEGDLTESLTNSANAITQVTEQYDTQIASLQGELDNMLAYADEVEATTSDGGLGLLDETLQESESLGEVTQNIQDITTVVGGTA